MHGHAIESHDWFQSRVGTGTLNPYNYLKWKKYGVCEAQIMSDFSIVLKTSTLVHGVGTETVMK